MLQWRDFDSLGLCYKAAGIMSRKKMWKYLFVWEIVGCPQSLIPGIFARRKANRFFFFFNLTVYYLLTKFLETPKSPVAIFGDFVRKEIAVSAGA
jgi:hypothetical protein